MELVGSEVAAYTDEEKSFHVARMWSEGLTPFRAGKLWGRPTRESLRAWEKLALSGELHVEDRITKSAGAGATPPKTLRRAKLGVHNKEKVAQMAEKGLVD